jgi:putative FmdB family regulatory protein
VIVVGATGFEPATSRSRTERSTKLSHAPLRADTPSNGKLEGCGTVKCTRSGCGAATTLLLLQRTRVMLHAACALSTVMRMPIFEYRCNGCGHEFEQLVRTGDTPECPECHAHSLEQLLSQVSVSSEHTRSLSFNKARQAAKRVQRDKDVAQAEYEKKHLEEGH